ncbi:hypothetical protein B566_EDAN018918 [Ephemera danica]|nr:hypothetical protein B566_EDAN018918 [Ephemera danica]
MPALASKYSRARSAKLNSPSGANSQARSRSISCASAWPLATSSAGVGFSKRSSTWAAFTFTRLPDSSSICKDASASASTRPAWNLPASSYKAYIRRIVAHAVAASDGHATADFDHRAVDVAGLIAGQEGVGVGNVLRLAQPVQRHLFAHVVQHLLGNGVQDRRFYKTRRHGIDANALGPELAAPGLGEADDAELAGGVIRLAEVAVDADHAAGVQDDAAALQHQGVDHGLGAVEHAAQVDVDHRIELRQRHLLQPRVAGDAGVVHQHVDAAEALLDCGHHGIDRGAVGDVDDIALGLHTQAAALRHHGINGGGIHVAHRHVRTFGGELDGGGRANALRRAGDDGDLLLELDVDAGGDERVALLRANARLGVVAVLQAHIQAHGRGHGHRQAGVERGAELAGVLQVRQHHQALGEVGGGAQLVGAFLAQHQRQVAVAGARAVIAVRGVGQAAVHVPGHVGFLDDVHPQAAAQAQAAVQTGDAVALEIDTAEAEQGGAQVVVIAATGAQGVGGGGACGLGIDGVAIQAQLVLLGGLDGISQQVQRLAVGVARTQRRARADHGAPLAVVLHGGLGQGCLAQGAGQGQRGQLNRKANGNRHANSSNGRVLLNRQQLCDAFTDHSPCTSRGQRLGRHVQRLRNVVGTVRRAHKASLVQGRRQVHAAAQHGMEEAVEACLVSGHHFAIVLRQRGAEEEAEHAALAFAHEGHAGLRRHLRKAIGQAAGARAQGIKETRPGDFPQRGQAAGRGHRVAAQGACLIHRTQRRQMAHDFARAAKGRQRHAAPDDLAENADVGLEARKLRRVQRLRTPQGDAKAAQGIPDEGIAPGTAWADVPMNWVCPECGARKEDFEMIQI